MPVITAHLARKMYALTLRASDNVAIQTLPIFLQVSFNIVATTTLIIWNTISSLEEEVELIWPSKFTFIKAVYFIARYLPFPIFCGSTIFIFGNITANVCTEAVWFSNIGGSIIITCSNILLIQRVYAFYERSNYIFWTLCSIFVLDEVVVSVILVLDLPRIKITKNNFSSPIPELFGDCIIEKFSSIAAYVWFCRLILETIAFICILSRFINLHLVARKTGLPNPCLYNVFLRDGIWAFFVSFLFSLGSAVLQRAQNATGLSLSLWAFALSSICSTHLILNLNYAVNKTQNSGARSFAGYLVSTNIALDLNHD